MASEGHAARNGKGLHNVIVEELRKSDKYPNPYLGRYCEAFPCQFWNGNGYDPKYILLLFNDAFVVAALRENFLTKIRNSGSDMQLDRHTLEKRLLEKDIKYAYRDHLSVKPQNDGFVFKELTQDMAERSVELAIGTEKGDGRLRLKMSKTDADTLNSFINNMPSPVASLPPLKQESAKTPLSSPNPARKPPELRTSPASPPTSPAARPDGARLPPASPKSPLAGERAKQRLVLEEDARKAKPDAAIKRTTSVEEVMLEAGKIGWLEPSDLSGDTHVAKPPMSPIRERKLPDMVSVSNPGSPQLSRTMVHRQNANMYDSNKSLSGSKSDGLPEIGSPRLTVNAGLASNNSAPTSRALTPSPREPRAPPDVSYNKCIRGGDLARRVEELEASNLLQAEFENLACVDRDDSDTYNAARAEANIKKNRYRDVLAKDATRVRLRSDGDGNAAESDYINANYVDGYHHEMDFICSQGPLKDTKADFWTMVWEENCAVIVMLTDLKEGDRVKCEKYWPDELDIPDYYGGVCSITPVSTEESPAGHVIVRKFILRRVSGADEGATREVAQVQYTGWPDHGVPESAGHLFRMMDAVEQLQKDAGPMHARSPGPRRVLVHCSAGIGRSGIYVVVDMARRQLRETDCVDIYGAVANARRARAGMVQSLAQYKFCYTAALEYYRLLRTK